MKIFTTLALLLTGTFALAQPSAAQPIVINGDTKAGRDLTNKLGKEYLSNPETNMSETPFSIVHHFQKACLAVVDDKKFENIAVRAAAYANEKGKVDYLIISVGQMFVPDEEKGKFPKSRLDSLSNLLIEGLKPFAEQMISRRTMGKKMMVGMYTNLSAKPQRESESRDSVINTVEGLTAVVDTAKIKHIFLTKSLLTEIPSSIYRFPNAETLMLNDNDIEEVNIDFARLPKLRQLDLTGNILSPGRIHFTKNKNLKMLMLLKSQLRDIPPAVKNCKGLETLWLGSNNMSGLSNKSFKRAKNIKDLNFYKAELTVLPKGIKKLKRLEVLDLYYNKLEALPNTITKLSNLTHLAVSYNQIGALPARIDRLSKVHTLFTHHNHLSKLPESITKMKNLKILDLGYNWFTQFPEQLTSFVNLQELDLSSNNFPEFPEQLLKIQKLEKLYLRGNPFIKPDSETKYSQQLTALKSKNIEVFY